MKVSTKHMVDALKDSGYLLCVHWSGVIVGKHGKARKDIGFKVRQE